MKMCSRKNLYMNVHRTTIIHSSQVEKIQMSINWRMDQYVVYPYKGILSSHKKNEVLRHATVKMNLENIVLCERSQLQKAT